jgi:hypothetical protein
LSEWLRNKDGDETSDSCTEVVDDDSVVIDAFFQKHLVNLVLLLVILYEKKVQFFG